MGVGVPNAGAGAGAGIRAGEDRMAPDRRVGRCAGCFDDASPAGPGDSSLTPALFPRISSSSSSVSGGDVAGAGGGDGFLYGATDYASKKKKQKKKKRLIFSVGIKQKKQEASGEQHG